MILVADGGSTKCDWVLLDNNGEILFKTRTKGLNPTVVEKTDLLARISENIELVNVFKIVQKVHFYGAGCGTITPRNILRDVLQELFLIAEISVQEDMMAAVYSVTDQPGIVCILGTGSNSCYYDGNEIHAPYFSLGYILMDEASGNYFGKKLIRDYYYKKMPRQIASEFEEKYNLDADDIKMNLYKKPNPNAYLASFAEFIFTKNKMQPYFHQFIKEGISEFIENHILCFQNSKEVPVHFIGSIAFFSEDIIKECLNEHNLKLGKIVQRPIDGLIDYYRNKML